MHHLNEKIFEHFCAAGADDYWKFIVTPSQLLSKLKSERRY
jgi:hypothetical protein